MEKDSITVEIEIADPVEFLGYVQPKWSDETPEQLLSRAHWLDVYEFQGQFTRCPYLPYHSKSIKNLEYNDENSQIVLN